MFSSRTAIIVTIVCALGAVAVLRSRRSGPSPDRHRVMASLLALPLVALSFGAASRADAAIVPTVGLGTSEAYSVLGGATVTNTGSSVLAASLGVWPGAAITGFPPGLVTPPGTTDAGNAAAQQAQSDLTTAYNDAAGRPLNGTTPADLADQLLVGGVYSGPGKGALGLTGSLILDGEQDPTSVFIFQTNSSLITASSSTVTLINGAQECNVFWQVGSSATLGTDSVMVGNILALTSITATTGATVHGRTLARNGAVTLDTNVFDEPTCATDIPTTTSSSTTSSSTTSSTTPGSTSSSTTSSTTPGSTSSSTTSSTTPGSTSSSTTIPGNTTTSLETTVSGVTSTTTRYDSSVTTGTGGTSAPTVPVVTAPPSFTG